MAALSVSKDFQIIRNNTIERGSSSPSVIVIGAGFAGIAAAHALKKNASIQVVVLESRDRIGGRVHTDCSLGFPIDLGACWLHGVCKQNPLVPTIAQLKLCLYRTSGENSLLYDHDLESYALYDANGKQVPHELVTCVGKVFERILKETENVRKDQKEDMSIKNAIAKVFQRNPDLRLEGLLHRILQWYLCRIEGWFSADADTISIQGWDQEELLPGGHVLMVQGYLPVVEYLAEELDIRLNHRVTKVARLSKGVVVTTADGIKFEADAAIVSVPLGVLKSKIITFEPPLPESKERAIDGIGLGLENKIVLHFEDAFWPDVDFFGMVSETTDGCSYFLNLHKSSGNPILVYMPAGKQAQKMEKNSDEDAANFALSQLKIFLPGAPNPINYIVTHWGSDVNTLGSYSYDKVGNHHELYHELRVPLENLFFAGEGTSARYPGSVHGAFSTGILAAEECRKYVRKQHSLPDTFQSEMTNDSSTEFSQLIDRCIMNVRHVNK